MIPPAAISFNTSPASSLPQRWLTDHTPNGIPHFRSWTTDFFCLRVDRTGKLIYKPVSPFLVNPHSTQNLCSSVDSHFRKHFIPVLFWEDATGGRATSTPTSQSNSTDCSAPSPQTEIIWWFCQTLWRLPHQLFLVEIKLLSSSREADNLWHSLHDQFSPSFKWTACTKRRL